MTSAPLAEVLRYVRGLADTNEGGDQSDGGLLRRFVKLKDEFAFAAILDRHGPLVLGVCRQVLREEQEAEDAFQRHGGQSVFRARWLSRFGLGSTCVTVIRLGRPAGTAWPWPAAAWKTSCPT
jgi:hypothetical protein